jgi:uncharacterized protein YhfF
MQRIDLVRFTEVELKLFGMVEQRKREKEGEGLWSEGTPGYKYFGV